MYRFEKKVSPSAAHVIEVASEIAAETLFYPSSCAVVKVRSKPKP
jgi:hypothetical protein